MEFILFTMITLIVIVALMATRLTNNSYPFPFDRKTSVFTTAEKNFHNLLEQAFGQKYRIINRVKLSDIVTVRQGVSKRASQSALAQANSRYLDFAICNKETMELVGVVDLVDNQGKGYKVKKDWFISGSLDAASIPHIRVKIKPSYSLDEIRACINSRILGNSSPTPKIAGKIIPAVMVKARPRNSGVLPKSALVDALPNKQLTGSNMAALPH